MSDVDNRKVIKKLLVLVIAMFGFGFALVPLYDVFCDITGVNGKTGGQVVISSSLEIDESREVVIDFVTSLNANMPWEFRALTKSVVVHPGQSTRIDFVAINKSDKTIIGQAIPSVAPGLAAQYFQKTECFCFKEQMLDAGEEKIMPVVFIVDPSLPDDINEMTLSYTFFIKPGSGVQPLALNQ